MQRVQRKVHGTFMKRSADQSDVGNILSEFQTADKLLDSFLDSARSFQNAWNDILAKQLAVAAELEILYKPIEHPESRYDTSASVSKSLLDKAVDYRAAYLEMQTDLQQETAWIQTKLLRPAMDAKESLAAMKKTIKKREDCKVDFERYQSRVDHAKAKTAKSIKDEAALTKHENDLSQATWAYNTADDHIRQTMPAVIDAVVSLVPLLLTNQVMLQHALVGQLYTVLHGYCQAHNFSEVAPSMEQVVAVWDREFTPLRLEAETALKCLQAGKAAHQPMTIPEKTTTTGFAIRSRVGLGQRKASNPGPVSPQSAGISSRPILSPRASHDHMGIEEETPPPKPMRPGFSSPGSGPGPIPLASKPRIGSTMSLRSQMSIPENEETPPPRPPRPQGSPGTPGNLANSAAAFTGYGSAVTTPVNSTPGGLPLAALRRTSTNDSARSTASTPFLTPLGTTQSVSSVSQTGDYFGVGSQRRPSTSSMASTIAGKKKPPPPPTKPKPKATVEFVTALFDFAGQGEGDLSFSEGDQIKVVKKTDSTDDWWLGELRGMSGAFPANYVKV